MYFLIKKSGATDDLIEISKKYSGQVQKKKIDKKWRNKKLEKKLNMH